MIPKIIHYCWFGRGELPELAKKCMESWEKFFPDYEIRVWNEDNYNINKNSYIKEAYERGKYAFVSDYARFDILYHEGGIYFDTDVEVIKSFGDILMRGAFMGCELDGDEEKNFPSINPGLGMAAPPRMDFFKEILEMYEGLHFVLEDGRLNTKTVVEYTTEILKKYGLQKTDNIQFVKEITIYPKEYFCPKDYVTGNIDSTFNSHAIHHYSESWHSEMEKKMTRIRQDYIKKYGREQGVKQYEKWCKRNIIRISIKRHGFIESIKLLVRRLGRR